MVRILRLFFVASVLVGAASSPAASAQQTLVVLGDSLTAGYGLALDQAFPAVLQEELAKQGFEVSVINAGVSGDTAEDGLNRLDWSTPKDATAVLVELGANDMLRGIDPETTKRALEKIVLNLERRDVSVMLAGMYASPTLGRDFASKFDRIYPELSAKLHVPLYPFFLQGVADKPEFLQKDGMHPNAAGVRVIASAILPQVEGFLHLRHGNGDAPAVSPAQRGGKDAEALHKS